MRKTLLRVLAFVVSISIACWLFPVSAFASSNDEADDIRYTMDSGEILTFDKKNFNEVCEDLTDEQLDYIKFDLPDDDDGMLYYEYDKDEEVEVSSSKKYYYSKSSYISKVSFVPDNDFIGTVTIEYEGYDVDDNSFTGEIKIKVEEPQGSNIISYSVDDSDETVDFEEDDFFDSCEEVQDENLDYVEFDLPDKDDGILYYNYDEDDEDDNTKVSSSKKYYYEDRSPYISKITFVPDKDFSGTVTIPFTAYDVEGDSFSGKVRIKVVDDDEDDSDEINYSIDDNDEVVDFDEEDFNDVCEELNNEELDYVKFTIPSASKGILYYNYEDGDYSSIVSSGKKYYYDQSPYIKNITFVPDEDFYGTCKISYKGYDVEGDSFSADISIIIGDSSGETAKIIEYTGTVNNIVIFKDEDFNSVCKSQMDSQLNYVLFTLPSTSYGTLYYGYSANGSYSSKVKESTKYYYGGSPYLLNVAFVPEKDITGTVTIPYKGFDINGSSYAGKVQILISNGSTIPIDTSKLVSSKYFSDVDISYSWAVPYIDSLYTAGIISGTSTGTGTKLYSPASNVTRGDFIYLLYKTLGFSTSSVTSDFSDVTSGSYYYTAIKTAKALGIVQGSENKFYPNAPVTREDAMVMVLRAVNITGSTISSGNTDNLSSYIDNRLISDYSRSAVAALIKAGIITGSDDNKIYPQGYLTRAQTAAIIYRVKSL